MSRRPVSLITSYRHAARPAQGHEGRDRSSGAPEGDDMEGGAARSPVDRLRHQLTTGAREDDGVDDRHDGGDRASRNASVNLDTTSIAYYPVAGARSVDHGANRPRCPGHPARAPAAGGGSRSATRGQGAAYW